MERKIQRRRHILARGVILSAIILSGVLAILGSGGSDQPSQTCLVTIHRPADGSVWENGQTIVFQGSGHNPDDDLPLSGSSLSWSSSLDGSLGTGNTITTSQLSVGLHAITLSCEDSGSVGSVAISVSILP